MKRQLAAKKAAIKKAGGFKPLARKLLPRGTHEEIQRLGWAIQKWVLVPPKWVLRVEKRTGVARHRLRPDIYPRRLAA